MASRVEADTATMNFDELSEAKLVTHERAMARSAVNCATHIRFSYPLWLKTTTVISSTLLILTFGFTVWLVSAHLMNGFDYIKFQLGLFLAAASSFLGFLVLSLAGHAAQRFSRSVHSWWRTIRSEEDKSIA
jgi:hypothetical protein